MAAFRERRPAAQVTQDRDHRAILNQRHQLLAETATFSAMTQRLSVLREGRPIR